MKFVRVLLPEIFTRRKIDFSSESHDSDDMSFKKIAYLIFKFNLIKNLKFYYQREPNEV